MPTTIRIYFTIECVLALGLATYIHNHNVDNSLHGRNCTCLELLLEQRPFVSSLPSVGACDLRVATTTSFVSLTTYCGYIRISAILRCPHPHINPGRS